MKPNTKFNLSVRDIELIEQTLNHHIGRLANRRIMHVESTIKPEHELDSVKEIDAEIAEVRELLGRIHNQKNWYRPSDTFYVSG